MKDRFLTWIFRSLHAAHEREIVREYEERGAREVAAWQAKLAREARENDEAEARRVATNAALSKDALNRINAHMTGVRAAVARGQMPLGMFEMPPVMCETA